MIKIYGKENCVFCNKAKTLLNQKAIDYEYESVDNPERALHLKENVLQIEPSTKITVPVIIIDGVWIGGYDELSGYLNENYALVGDKYERILIG